MSERATAATNARLTRQAGRLARAGLAIAAIAAVPSVVQVVNLISEQRAANPDITAWAIAETVLLSPFLLSVVVLTFVGLEFLRAAVVFTWRLARYLHRSRKRGYVPYLSGYRRSGVDHAVDLDTRAE